jgi:23S rRNA pseudouridine1911/1915/1917 synthase
MPRLIDILQELGKTRREARDLLAGGKVFYRGVPTADEGREVDLSLVDVRPAAPRIKPGRDLVILHRDEHLAVVWKPSGMLAVPALGRRHTPVVTVIVARLLGSAFAVHRLDEPTSGLMVVALTEACQAALKDLFADHRIERRYLAIVTGWFPEVPCTARSHIVRDRGDGLRGSIGDENAGGREAVTHLRLVERLGPRASLVEARLETGRTHQVRIHLAERKHAILGDELYGSAGVTRAARRLALHAALLGFHHPITGDEMSFEAPLADDLEKLRRKLAHVDRPSPVRAKRRRTSRKRRR